MKKYYHYLTLITLMTTLLIGCQKAEQPSPSSTGSIKNKISENKEKQTSKKKKKDQKPDKEKEEPSSSESQTKEVAQNKKSASTQKETAQQKYQETTQNTRNTNDTNERSSYDETYHQSYEHDTTKTNTKSNSEISSPPSSSASSTPSRPQATHTLPWTPQKTEELRSFMASWQKEMGQTYNEATSERTVNRLGMDFPNAVTINGVSQVNTPYEWIYNDQIPISFDYNQTGVSEADYTVVGIYIQAPTQYTGAGYTYFFTLDRNQQPKIFLFVQTQAAPDEKFHVYDTENEVLVNGFKTIATQ